MTYQEEEQSRLRRQNSREAIALALKGQWREAIAVNKSILEIFANDVEALNRLGRAYMELGQYHEAEVSYRHALEIDSCRVWISSSFAWITSSFSWITSSFAMIVSSKTSTCLTTSSISFTF